MKQCKDCIHYKMCAWCVDADNCLFFQTSADLARGTLSDFKKQVHDVAVYPHSVVVDPYISLKAFDATLENFIRKVSK